MKEFDITGFVNFPRQFLKNIKRLETGKTFVYLTAFDNRDTFSKIQLDVDGNYSGDDLSPKKNANTSRLSLDEIVNLMKIESTDMELEHQPLISCVLLGWSNFTYKSEIDIQPWSCGFHDLTEEGRKLYYSFKKLHNTKEIRLLTFDSI